MHAQPTGQTSAIEQILADVHRRTLGRRDGELADYIPELGKVAPDPYGIAIATLGGKLHCIGDVDVPFTIQSISKALTFCMALELLGREDVFARVGVEPSGDAFNAIEFDPVSRRPYNPMVNAGAITVAGMLRDALGGNAFEILLERFSLAAGRALELDEAVYRSEAASGHRNRAIGHLLLSVGALREPVDPVLDLYFRQCAIQVTARDLALIGATIANMGENPVSGTQVFDVDAVRDTLAVMFTCGMYDYSGNWAYDVGVPAKSGVGGGIIGVVNRQLGIGTFSPRLDAKGNSVRGVCGFRMLSDELGLHAFDPTNRGSALVDSFLAR
ncbi:glutaminase A [Pseudomonas lopnurensis]|uniref:glutaminase A n=1 Tax=Pseudomonas lopnurensis TaxID=1477517 RepID=UPI00187A0BC0|nr:glutaminase A [Pseudomonas lopnurensis]MBE7374433.1 glutaminase A [Pseudomonas lopnurensis]